MTAAQGGDRGALDQLFRIHYDRVVAVCRRITGNESDAADAAQEAMIAIVRGLPRFDGRSSFGTWAYRIATNASLDELRRRRRRPAPALRHDDSEARTGRPRRRIAPRPVADRDALDAALLTVPEDFRVPVVLRDVADLDYSEIAEVLDVPIGTVKSRIARGRGMLAVAFHQHGGNQHGESERPTRGSPTGP